MSIALAIPHRPDQPARVENLRRMRAVLESGFHDMTIRVLDDILPNREWARRMWRWGLEFDAFVTLQDDTELAPRFLDILRAMLPAVPPRAILGLAGHHPGLNSQPGPWARSGGWVVGWAYAMGRETLRELVAFDATGEEANLTEDSFINSFAGRTGRPVWHPVPSPVDHRTELPSTYENDGRHPFRRSVKRWEGWPIERLTDPAYWRITGDPPLMAEPAGFAATHVMVGGSGPPTVGPGYDYAPGIVRRVGGY